MPVSTRRYNGGGPMRAICRIPDRYAARCALALCTTLWISGGTHAADDYLSAIEAEGNRIEFLSKARQEEAAVRRQQQSNGAAASTPPSPVQTSANPTSMRGFEDELRAQFPGSFALYSLMGQKEREMVYAEFGNSKATGAARFLPVISRIIAITTQKRAKGK